MVFGVWRGYSRITSIFLVINSAPIQAFQLQIVMVLTSKFEFKFIAVFDTFELHFLLCVLLQEIRGILVLLCLHTFLLSRPFSLPLISFGYFEWNHVDFKMCRRSLWFVQLQDNKLKLVQMGQCCKKQKAHKKL